MTILATLMAKMAPEVRCIWHYLNAEIKEEQFIKYWRKYYERTKIFVMIIKWQRKAQKADIQDGELIEGERLAIKLMQKESFKEEEKSRKVRSK